MSLAALILFVAIPAKANAAVLYDSGFSGSEAEVAQNTRAAQQFTPTTSGTASFVSFAAYAYCCPGGPDGPAPFTLRIHEDLNNHPGTQIGLASGTVSDNAGEGIGSCLSLIGNPILSSSQKYWFVLEAHAKRFQWYRGQTGGGLFRTSTDGSTWSAATQDSFSAWVSDTGCSPHATTNPAKSTTIGDMYIKSGASTFNSITIGNDGAANLSVTGQTITGANASSFRVLNNDPNGVPPGQPVTYPRTLGPGGGGVIFLYPTCDGSGQEGERRATLTISTNDPTQPTISWDLFCIIDNTPPTIQFTNNPTGRAGWHLTNPAPLRVQGIDPQPGAGVKRIYCEDGDGGGTWLHNSGSVADFLIAGEGVHSIYCEGTDVANNTSALGAALASVAIDSIAPNATPVSGPEEATTATAASFEFTTSDASPGSGVQEIECSLDSGPYTACTSPASRSGLADGEHTFRVRVRDVAGHYDATPASWTWRVDTTPPDTTLTGGPPDFTKARTASFNPPAGSDGGVGVARVECSLDGAAFTVCPAPPVYSALTEGRHILRARAVDLLNHVDPTPAISSWIVDLTKPVISKLKARKRSLSYRSSEAAAVTVVLERFDRGRFVKEKTFKRRARDGGNKLRLPRSLAAGRYRASITAVDRAGHKSKRKRLSFRL